ncbi:unnamed protein product, partial [Aphanomyces euteiches]
LSCTVVVGSTEISCQFESVDFVQTVVKLAQVHFVNEHNGDASQLVGLRNRRTNRDLYYFSAAGEEIQNGDVLEGRPYTAAPPTVSEQAMTTASTRNRKFKKQMSRPGFFHITILKAEGIDNSAHIVTVRLDPYTLTLDTPPSSNREWKSLMKFKHPDPWNDHLFLDFTIFREESRDSPLGHVRVQVSRCILTPGIPVTEWLTRISVRYCFHPIVYKMTKEMEISAAAKIFNSAIMSKRPCKSIAEKSTKEIPVEKTSVVQAPIRGFLSLFVKGLHICGPQCSKLDGHSSLYVPDFDPIVAVGFEQQSKEIPLHATGCNTLVFKKKFEVHSSFSSIEIDVLKPMTIASSPKYTRLRNGKQAVRYGTFSMNMMELLQRQGTSWTAAPMPLTLGPGKSPPEPGFDWYILRQSDEEVGLIQLQAAYVENYYQFLSSHLHPDATYIRPEEMDFSADIIKRNIERLDAIISAIKSSKVIIHEILEWKSPLLTLTAWISLMAGVWHFPISHFPAAVITVLLIVLVVNWFSFMRGEIQHRWTYFDPDEIKMKMFRSIATLRVVPLAAENLLEPQFTDSRCKDGTRPMDSYVRIYYEPHFKDLPERLIAQTNTVCGSRSPQYGQTTDILGVNNKWFKDMFLHLSPLAKDAVLQDVVEAWKRHDGGTDMQAFKYPLLQPVRINPITDIEETIDWDECPGMIRFDVVQDNPISSSQNLLGRVRLPLKALVTSARLGGAQIEIEKSFILEDSPVAHDSDCPQPTLKIRAQLVLRDPSKRATWKERLASETLYSVLEMESAKSLSLVEKYHMARNVARTIQHELGKICDLLEKIKNFFIWTHPQKTALAFFALCIAAVVTAFVPMKYFLLYTITKKFTNRFHRLCDMRLIDRDVIRVWNFISSFPSDIEEQHIFRHANQQFLREKEHTTAQAKLQADWTGYIYKRGEGVFVGWAYRYAAVRNGKLEYWNTIEDAKHGIPPKGFLLFSSTIDKCTKAELSSAPKDTFPFVVFNVDPKHLLISPEGRRRVVAVTTEQDYHDIVRAIQNSS